MSDTEYEGSCLCGSVRFRVVGTGTSRCWCHCRSCRLAFSSPFVAWATFPAAEFRLMSGELTAFQSSEPVTRGFCGSCGSGLTYQTQERPDKIDIAVSSLMNGSALRPEYHIWVSEKVPWVSVDVELPHYAEWRTGRSSGTSD